MLNNTQVPGEPGSENGQSADTDDAPEASEKHLHAGIAFLRTAKAHQYEIQKRLFEADPETLYHADLVAFGVMERSNALIDGFTMLVEQKNALAAAPLLRLQIDSIIRFNACWLVDDPSEVVTALFGDQPLGKLKDRAGKRMTDKYLVQSLAEKHPSLPDLYRQASSFIHLSVRQLAAPLMPVDSTSRRVHINLGASREWSLRDRLQAVEMFIDITDALFQLLNEWIENRRRFRQQTQDTSSQQPRSSDPQM